MLILFVDVVMPYFREHSGAVRYPVASQDAKGFRPAQLAAAHAVSAHLFASPQEPAIVVMPTGSGKTCVMAASAFMLRPTRALVVTPSRMVRDQIGQTLGSMELLRSFGSLDLNSRSPIVTKLESPPSRLAEWNALRRSDVVVATIQSASPALERVSRPPTDLFDFIICDEAHHEPAPTWRALLDHFPGARKLLLTATPFRRDRKAIRGKIVFDYPLSRARDDGVFGQLAYLPVETDSADGDVALAKAAEASLEESRKLGHRDLMMVRTATIARAKDLALVYQRETNLRLRRILGSHTSKHVQQTVQMLRTGKLDGVICVDMLGEGFDLPELKIAVLHSPHKSLAVTLQFIGRFARTNASDVGVARFLAIPSEIQPEALPLYEPGAEWNELVEQASRERIEIEVETREVLQTFEAPSSVAPTEASTEAADLSKLAPFFHVKVLDVEGTVDLAQFDPSGWGEVLVHAISDEIKAVVGIARQVGQCRWTRDSRLLDVSHSFFVLFYDEPSRLLFICTSERTQAAYDAITSSVVEGAWRRLTPYELNRVLRDIQQPDFFSLGMRNRSAAGSGESYRMITGKKADRVIHKADGRFYDRGHCFGRGTANGRAVTIGFSSSSKVWANRWEPIPSLFRWCRELATKLRDEREVKTNSGIDNLPLAMRATSFDDELIAVEWNQEVYSQPGYRLIRDLGGGQFEDHPLLDVALRVSKVSAEEALLELWTEDRVASLTYRLRSPFFRCGSDDSLLVEDAMGQQMELATFLSEYCPSVYTARLALLEGDSVSSPNDMGQVFNTADIETIDWASVGVDPTKEKPNAGPSRSLFEWLEERLLSGPSAIVYRDDASGEAADYVEIGLSEGELVTVGLYHCKGAPAGPIPGKRVKDLYEVVGQAAKSVRFSQPNVLSRHLRRRLKSTRDGRTRLLRGTDGQIAELLGRGGPIRVAVWIVQPGLGIDLSPDQSQLLASLNTYLLGGQIEPLRCIGSVSKK